MDQLDLRESAEGVTLEIKVQPRARKNELELEGGRLKVRLAAPPVEGKANAALAKVLAQVFKLRASDVEMLRGASGRLKVVRLRGVTAAAVRARLQELLG